MPFKNCNIHSHFIRKLRQRDVTKFHVQMAIAMLLMLVVFMAGFDRTETKPGCVTVGVLLHYLILVAFSWLAAEAELMFLKLVIIFTTLSLKYIVFTSIICWGKILMVFRQVIMLILPLILSLTAVPLIPVVISVSINHEYYITVPNNETGAPGL